MTRLMKWLVGLLAVSLAVNLFLAGFIAARTFSPDKQVRQHPVPDFNLRSFAGSLPEEARHDLQQKFREERRNIAAHYQNIREAREEIHTLLTTNELDEKALREKFEEIREIEAAMESRVQTLILDSLKSLEPDVRKEVVRRFHKRMQSRRRR